MYHSDDIGELVAALAKAKSQFSPLTKRGFNPHFKSFFADLTSINESINYALCQNGLAVMQSLESAGGEIIGVNVQTRLVHSSGQWISTGVAFFPATKGDAQGIGSAATYGRRYQLSALLCLAADDDDDGNAASTPSDTKSVKSRAQAAKQKSQPQKDGENDAFGI